MLRRKLNTRNIFTIELIETVKYFQLRSYNYYSTMQLLV